MKNKNFQKAPAVFKRCGHNNMYNFIFSHGDFPQSPSALNYYTNRFDLTFVESKNRPAGTYDIGFSLRNTYKIIFNGPKEVVINKMFLINGSDWKTLINLTGNLKKRRRNDAIEN